jgi:hypothetical protein
MIPYLIVCLAALLLAAAVLYLTAVHVPAAVVRLPHDAGSPRPVHDVPYATLINHAAETHHLNPALVAAVVAAESGFNARARSPRGAHGLMQVLPVTWREFGSGQTCAPEIARLTDPPCMDDPAANLETGTVYLRRLVDQFKGDLPLALAAYNAGAGTVQEHDGIPPFPETTRYLRQVALAWFHLQRDGTLTPVWRRLLSLVGLGSYARSVALVSLSALIAPFLRRAPRAPLVALGRATRR